MNQNKLAKHQSKLDVKTNEILQELVVLTKSTILLTFETQYQLWDISSRTLISSSQNNPKIFEWIAPTPCQENSILYIKFDYQRDLRELYYHHVESHHQQKIHQFSKQGSINKIVSFFNGDVVRVVVNGKDNTKVITTKNYYPELTLEPSLNATKFNDNGNLILYQTKPGKNKFWICRQEQGLPYQVQISAESVIDQMRPYDNNHFLVSVITPGLQSHIILFKIDDKKTMKTWVLDYLIDSICIIKNEAILLSVCNQTNKITSTVLEINKQNEMETRDLAVIGETFFTRQIPFLSAKSVPQQGILDVQFFDVVTNQDNVISLLEKTQIVA